MELKGDLMVKLMLAGLIAFVSVWAAQAHKPSKPITTKIICDPGCVKATGYGCLCPPKE
jgi:hypothetical protein